MRSRSAVDAVTPAFQRTKELLFAPFQLRRWAKLALLAMLMGGSGGGGGVRGPSFPSGGGPGGGGGGGAPDFGPLRDWVALHHDLMILGIVAAVVLLLLLSFLFSYLGSVARFVFMDSVIHDRVEIRRRWHELRGPGWSFCLFQWGIGLLFLGLMGLMVGLPVLAAYNGGAFENWDANATVGLVLLIIAAVFLFIFLALLVGVIMSLTRDLVLPVMYLRNEKVLLAWSSVWPKVKGNAGSVAVYVLLKIALGMGAAIGAALVSLVGALVLCIPLGLIGLFVYGVIVGLHLTWSWYWLWAIIPLGFILLLGIGYFFSLLLLPIPVFFQSYALKYLGYLDDSLVTIADVAPGGIALAGQSP